jgi:hypothetical protein
MPTFVYNLSRIVRGVTKSPGLMKKSTMYGEVITIKYSPNLKNDILTLSDNVAKKDLQTTKKPRFYF